MRSQKKWNLKKKESWKKMRSQKNEISKKEKKNENKTFSELKNFRTQSVSCQTKTVPEYVRIQVMSESDNVRVR